MVENLRLRTWRVFNRFRAKILICFLLAGCGGGLAPEAPVNLPVPFAAAFNSNAQVVVVDGMAVGASNSIKFKSQFILGCAGKSFAAFSSNGSQLGNCFYDESKINPVPTTGPQTVFSMPVCCLMDNGEIVRSDNMEFFQLPHEDQSKDLCSLIPAGESCDGTRLIRGAGSGVISAGTGSFESAAGALTLEHRFASVVKGEGKAQRFLYFLEGVWILNRKATQ